MGSLPFIIITVWWLVKKRSDVLGSLLVVLDDLLSLALYFLDPVSEFSPIAHLNALELDSPVQAFQAD